MNLSVNVNLTSDLMMSWVFSWHYNNISTIKFEHKHLIFLSEIKPILKIGKNSKQTM